MVLMEHPALKPMPKENHATMIEFWTDQARALLAEPEPDMPLIMACDEMMSRHEDAAVGDMQQQTVNGMQAEAPLREEEEAAAAAEAENQAAMAEAEDGRMREQKTSEAAGKSEDRQHQVALKAMELASRERQAAKPQARA